MAVCLYTCHNRYQKKIFSLDTPQLNKAMDQSETPLMIDAHTPLCQPVVLFVKIDSTDWKLSGNNQSLSNSVFSVSSYILVLRYRIGYHIDNKA